MSSVATELFNKIYKIINPEASNPSLDRTKSRKRPAEEIPPLTRKFRRVSDFSKSYPAVLIEEPRRTYVIPVEKSFRSRFTNSGVFGMSKYSKGSRKLESDYADIEYSDEDDQEVIYVTEKVPRQQQGGPSSSEQEKAHRRSTGATAKLFLNGGDEEEDDSENRRQNNNRTRIMTKSPPFLTRGALMLSRVPGLHPIDRSQFKPSSNTFRPPKNATPSILQNGSIFKWGKSNLFDLNNSNSYKVNNLSSSSAKSPLVKTNLNSIVTKTMNLDERHKYFDLLKSCAPDLYNDGNVPIPKSVRPRGTQMPNQTQNIVPNLDLHQNPKNIAYSTSKPLEKRDHSVNPVERSSKNTAKKVPLTPEQLYQKLIQVDKRLKEIKNALKPECPPIQNANGNSKIIEHNKLNQISNSNVRAVGTRYNPIVNLDEAQNKLLSNQRNISNVPKTGRTNRNINVVPPITARYKPIIIPDDEDEVVEIPLQTQNKAAARATNIPYKPPDVTPVNSLRNKFLLRAEFQEGWLLNISKKYDSKEQQRNEDILQQTESVYGLTQKTRQNELDIQKKLQDVCIASDIIQIDDSSESDDVEVCEFPELSSDDKKFIDHVSRNGPSQEIIIEKFNLRITRQDLGTLVGLNWLNDEVINFYMNLLNERSEQLKNNGYPKVYTMNTFFIPRLIQSGHCGVRRWTRKVDIFSYDIIPVPVHVGQVHWCMAIIHLKNKTIKYYDSMATPNPAVLRALENYLKEESLDKRKIQFCMTDWEIESVKSLPRQMNGSDCGVFSCMFAEYITRNKAITFSQQNMVYFRQKMIYEIAKGKLLT